MCIRVCVCVCVLECVCVCVCVCVLECVCVCLYLREYVSERLFLTVCEAQYLYLCLTQCIST